MEAPRTTARPRAGIRGLARRALATLAVVGVALTGAVVSAPAAQAATAGYGLGTFGDSTYGYFGSFRAPDGSLVYCFQPSVPLPSGATGAGVLSNPGENGLPSDPNRVAGMNAVLTEYGQTTDPVTAMAVMKATQALATSIPETTLQYGNSVPTWAGLAGWVAPNGTPLTAAQQAQFISEVTAMYDLGTSTVAGGGGTPAAGNLEFSISSTTDYVGTVTAVATGAPGATGTITLTHGVFDATGTNVMTDAELGVAYPFHGAPPNAEWDASDYSVTGTGTFRTAGSGYSANLTVYETPGQQSTAAAGTRSTVEFTLGGADPAARSVGFSPVVGTRVASVYLEAGDVPADVLQFGVADGSEPWFQSSGGRWAPVTANGTLYGPFTSEPVEADSAPANAAIAGTATVTTDPAVDPMTTEVTVPSDTPVTDAGYYVWQWEIDIADQRDSVGEFFPIGYNFLDRFGQIVETSVVAMNLTGSSQVSESETGLGGSSGDTLTVTNPGNGNWLESEGGRVPVTYRASAYFVEGTEAPEITDTVPADATLLGSSTHTISRPGVIEATPQTAPFRVGHVVWVWEIREADQAPEYAGFVADWADPFGIPAEMTRVVAPIVTTQAQTDVPVGDPIRDTAIVAGRVPAELGLHFELYEATRGEGDEWVCTEGNLLWTSESQPVTAEGTYTSPASPILPAGTYNWVEVLTAPDGGEISRGICGLPSETSVIVTPTVTTSAQPSARLGEEPGLFDVATVTGPIAEAGYNLTFEAYKVPVVKDETTGEWAIDYPEDFVPSDEPGANNLTWVCDAEPVFTTEEAIHVTAEGEFTSESFVPEEFGKYLWVETLTTIPAEGEEALTIHRGECGIAEESAVIVDVTTKAQTDNGDQTVDTGEQAWDKAILNGYVPEGATVTIVGYQASDTTPVTEACTAETQVFEWTSEPLPGGMAENLEVDSAKFTPKHLDAESTVFFIETTKDALGRTVSTGECGEPDETLGVKGDGTIAFTGGDSTPALFVGGFALMALFGASALYAARRRATV